MESPRDNGYTMDSGQIVFFLISIEFWKTYRLIPIGQSSFYFNHVDGKDFKLGLLPNLLIMIMNAGLKVRGIYYIVGTRRCYKRTALEIWSLNKLRKREVFTFG